MAYYVNMHDTFMSGWGEAKGKRALYCIRCDTLAQAEAIEQAAHKRSEMRRIAISDNPRRAGNNQRTIKNFSDMGGPWLEFYRAGE